MRIAFDVGPVRNQPTGVGLFALAMANAMAENLSRAELLLFGKRRGVYGLPTTHPTLARSPNNYFLWLQTVAGRQSRAHQADISHYTDGMIPLARAGTTVVSIHDLSVVRHWRTHPRRRLLRVPFALAAVRTADLIIVPSTATADEVIRYGGSTDRIRIVPYAPQPGIGLPADEVIGMTLSRYGLAQNSYILGLGTIEPRKNHLRLIEAFELGVSSGAISSDIDLVFAGQEGWHSGETIRRMGTSGLASRIKHLGYVPLDDLSSLLAGSAVVAYPSLYEGFGLPVVEAMACGAAVVTSSISSMPEVARDGGYLVDPFVPAAIAAGIGAALRDVAADGGSVRARSLSVAKHFTWQATASAVIDAYGSAFE